MELADYEKRLQELEKANRILQKKLERSEADRVDLEKTNDKNQALLKSVIRELEESKTTLEEKSWDLEQALKNLQAMQAKLVASEKMSALGVLVAGVAHEINNPVNFIYGNLIHAQKYTHDLLELVQLYQQCYPNPTSEIQEMIEASDLDFLCEDLPKLLKSMNVGTERIREIVKSLRNFSRLNEAEFKVVDIHEGLDSALMILHNRLKPKADHPGIEVIKEYGQLPPVECCPGQLNQVFINLLTNAIDALDEGIRDWELEAGQKVEEMHLMQGKSFSSISNSQSQVPIIQIRTEIVQDNWVAIRIGDNGLGMSEDVHSKLFDPFFTTKPVGKGTGLGLSISYQIVVEKHGGKMQCYSAPGQGAEFVVQIPLRQSIHDPHPC
ncbi:sensor histidine kinase [Microcoleus sp. FACHB-SPT15]|uniref:sensor histidine kinase n=1 Tax=Microcoleus sp. FACHB-SPT15 TaxID=2692830 RepID=UPI0017853517|nr:ATP-binding protein [Microcoleus sp. FACHB-SPT15]MBD1809095.1 sensor histidine kinase [Microcoleus sp. FACHB-SPT15]